MASGLTSVVIVTYWSAQTIGSCLDAVFASTARIEVVVVDNGSDDGTVELVRKRMTGGAALRLIVNDDNPGFAAACNQGIAQAVGDVVFLLNPDAFVDRAAIQHLRENLASDPGLGLLGCRVIDERGRLHGPQCRREPTWRRSLASALGLAALERYWPRWQGVEMTVGWAPDICEVASQVQVVDAVNGSAMMLPAVVVRVVGGLDPAFRLHAEDLDLCRRVRDAGWRVGYLPAVSVTHIGGVSSRQRPFWVEWQKTRSLWRYFRKHDQAASHPLVALLVGLGLLSRYLVKLPVLSLRRLRQRA